MRRTVTILLVLGLVSLVVGIAQACSPLTNVVIIHTYGTIGYPSNNETSHEETLPKQTDSTTQLDIMGFLTIIASFGFFTFAYINNRNSYGKEKLTVTEKP